MFLPWNDWIARRRLINIKSLHYPETVTDKILQVHPYACPEAIDEWKHGFKRYLMLHLSNPSKKQSLAMPSEAVDSVWHACLLHTRWYEAMCRDCLGYFLHHTPFADNRQPKNSHQINRELISLQATYILDCKEQGIEPDGVNIPLLFMLDKKWSVSPGYHYGAKAEVLSGAADYDIAMLSKT